MYDKKAYDDSLNKLVKFKHNINTLKVIWQNERANGCDRV